MSLISLKINVQISHMIHDLYLNHIIICKPLSRDIGCKVPNRYFGIKFHMNSFEDRRDYKAEAGIV